MIYKILPDKITCLIRGFGSITEIRMRVGSKLIYYDNEGHHIICNYIVKSKDIEQILQAVSDNSLYTVNDMLTDGYIVYLAGIRIGVIGECVIENEKVISVKYINSLNIRIPSEISINTDIIHLSEKPKNTLIISPPGAGKTTLLRAITRHYSDKEYNTLLIDERYELAGATYGKAVLDVGNHTDILSGTPKKIAYTMAIRSMKPDVISTDEIISIEETNSIIDAVYSGVKIFATVHAENQEELRQRKSVCKLLDIAEYIITLSTYPKVGTIISEEFIN